MSDVNDDFAVNDNLGTPINGGVQVAPEIDMLSTVMSGVESTQSYIYSALEDTTIEPDSVQSEVKEAYDKAKGLIGVATEGNHVSLADVKQTAVELSNANDRARSTFEEAVGASFDFEKEIYTSSRTPFHNPHDSWSGALSPPINYELAVNHGSSVVSNGMRGFVGGGNVYNEGLQSLGVNNSTHGPGSNRLNDDSNKFEDRPSLGSPQVGSPSSSGSSNSPSAGLVQSSIDNAMNRQDRPNNNPNNVQSKSEFGLGTGSTGIANTIPSSNSSVVPGNLIRQDSPTNKPPSSRTEYGLGTGSTGVAQATSTSNNTDAVPVNMIRQDRPSYKTKDQTRGPGGTSPGLSGSRQTSPPNRSSQSMVQSSIDDASNANSESNPPNSTNLTSIGDSVATAAASSVASEPAIAPPAPAVKSPEQIAEEKKAAEFAALTANWTSHDWANFNRMISTQGAAEQLQNAQNQGQSLPGRTNASQNRVNSRVPASVRRAEGGSLAAPVVTPARHVSRSTSTMM